MSTYELKTKKNDADVSAFVETLDDAEKKEAVKTMMALMRKATGKPPVMWGGSIIGYGTYRYRYASGQEGDWFLTGLSPRKQNITLYIMPGFERYNHLMEKLGTYKTGKSCLYIKKLMDIDLKVLEELIRESVQYMKSKHGVK